MVRAPWATYDAFLGQRLKSLWVCPWAPPTVVAQPCVGRICLPHGLHDFNVLFRQYADSTRRRPALRYRRQVVREC